MTLATGHSVGVDRRRFIALSAALLAGGVGGHAHASGLRGCCILPANASSAYRQTFNKRPTDPDKAAWERRLGDASGISPGFESALGELLVDMSRQFTVRPGFAFYDDGASPNAMAIDKTVVRRTNGMIAFGRTMLRKQLQIDGQGISVAAICAHEFAHIYQYQSGFYSEIEDRYPSHIIELHADFLAGAYLHRMEQTRPISLNGVGRAWEEMGDSRFTRASTHGSSAMRLDSIQAGYFWVEKNPGERMHRLASAGVAHVKRHAQG